MIKLKIKYGNSQTDLRFPCTEKDMNAALERIHAEDVTPLELYVSEVVFPEELGCLQDRFVNLDEVNFLGKRMASFFGDEFGTLPKIESAEMMFSASRSRRLQIVPIIQSFAQLDKNYGKEGAEIIVDNTQDTIFGGFAPNSSSAETLSKALGSRTVMSGSVSRSKNDPSQSLQMIERPLLTPDELKSLPKGDFIVMKTGVHPMRVHLKLFFKWGIEFDEDNPYAVPDHGGREVQYAEKKEIMDGIIKKYHPDWIVKDKPATDGGNGIGGQDQAESESHEPQQTPPKKPGDKKGGGGAVIREKPSAKQTTPLPKPEVKPNEPS